MERMEVLVCCAVIMLGLFSAATGFAAEATRVKESQIKSDSATDCVSGSPAWFLVMIDIVLLSVAHYTPIFAITGCSCSCRRRSLAWPEISSWTVDFTSVVPEIRRAVPVAIDFIKFSCSSCLSIQNICLISSVITCIMACILVLPFVSMKRYYNCYVVKEGYYAGIAVLSFVSVVLVLIHYLIVLNSGKNAGGIAMGPVSVPEHTYARKQGIV